MASSSVTGLDIQCKLAKELGSARMAKDLRVRVFVSEASRAHDVAEELTQTKPVNQGWAEMAPRCASIHQSRPNELA
jgi:hypothetical protein